MRVKRHKKFHRYINYFEKNFFFHSPFQVLVDGTFANALLANKVNMREQLPKYFEGECKLVTTPCAIIESEKLGPSVYGAVQILKDLQLHKCEHAANPIPASDCLKSVACKNGVKKSAKCDPSKDPADHFIVATQDGNLRAEFRKRIGVPLLYLYGNAPTMEKPADATVKWVEKRERKKLGVSSYQQEILQQIKSDVIPTTEESQRKGTKKRKRVGPNPLSCKKAKKDPGQGQASSSGSHVREEQPKKKRKRVKVRLPKHVKELTSSAKQ